MGCENCTDLELCSCEDGNNAWTRTVNNYTQPAVNTNVNVTVSGVNPLSGNWAGVGQIIFIVGGGYYEVVTAAISNVIVVKYTSDYTAFNQALTAAGVGVSSGARVSPGGLKGASGSAGSAGASGASLIAIDHNQLGANNPTSQAAYSAVQETVTIDSDNRLDAVGDSLRIRAKFFYNYVSGTDTPEVKIEFYQTGPIIIPLITYPIEAKYPGLEVEIILTRSATAGSIDFTTKVNLFTHFGYTYSTEAALGIGGIYYNEGIAQGGTINFTSDFEIQFSGKVSDPANAIKVGFYSVEFLNKI